MSHRKRVLIAAIVAATTFSTVFAVAASLSVSSSSLGAGSASVASCTASVTTSYDTAYSSAVPGYKVTTVHVAGIDTPACDGKSMRVTLVGASDVSLSEQTVTLGTPVANPTNLSFSSDNVAASAVVKVAVVISG